MEADLATCVKRNVHKRTEKDIQALLNGWEETPRNYLRTDVRSMLQSVAIDEVIYVDRRS